MGSRGLLLLKVPSQKPHHFLLNKSFSKLLIRNCSTTKTTTGSSLQPPDLPRLAQTARISLTTHEIEEFAPKIRQVIDWFGQLQAVDLNSIEPAIRAVADTEGDNLRDDIPETFDNREAMIAAVPSYETPYIKVPKVLNKE
ncbi:Glu-tRNAGln domain-containing protein [Cephalotus follicularis]|uniref:Glutamyl-tRNA(Gln) amidotransferase subunit C, chloroplastic/mitochondrial n=1 Tax=Cephalotus follicularis TaxID=3775 RepID=A0A1Q3AMM0_CEPFO|nr:Glu-tRNAGln domain-containing protein [Cephalotus follicularis]